MKNLFKESIKIVTKRNVDEMLCTMYSNKMEDFCKNLDKQKNNENQKKIDEAIEITHDRINKISRLFIDFDKNSSYIEGQHYSSKNKKCNKVDKCLQIIVKKSSENLCENLKDEKQKELVMQRMRSLIIILENFDENIFKLQRFEMQQTKMGELIFIK